MAATNSYPVQRVFSSAMACCGSEMTNTTNLREITCPHKLNGGYSGCPRYLLFKCTFLVLLKLNFSFEYESTAASLWLG